MKLRVEISQDTFSPLIKKLKKRSTGSQMRTFLQSTDRILRENIVDAFNRQVYFDGSSERGWALDRPETVRKRTGKGTWHGQSTSILKEYLELYQSLYAGPIRVKRETDGYSVSLQAPSRTHSTAGISINALALLHQEGTVDMQARPPMTMLEQTQDRLIQSFINYFFR